MDDNLGLAHTAVTGSISAAAGSAQEFLASNFSFDTVSRATSPGVPGSLRPDDDNKKRYRQRTFSYLSQLPYPVEDEAERDATLAAILKNLYISIKAEDFAPGAVHWSRELQGWLNLKFDMTRDLRASLAKLYYHLAMAPGLESTVTDRFGRMLITLTKKKHYLKPGDDLVLDWHPLWKQLKSIVLPSEIAVHQSVQARVYKQILRLCLHVQSYLDPGERREMLDEILPYFSTPDISNSFVVIGLLTIMVPTTPAPPTKPQSQPSAFLPTYFHLWSLVNRSKAVDVSFLDILSRLARDHLTCAHVPFTEHGIFTKDQSDLLFTSLLRLTEIPVGQANSPYVSSLSYASGLAVFLDKDRKKYPIPYMAARWIAHSLSPACLLPQDNNSSPASSVLTGLEGFLESIDTFFHPSNQGVWTSFLAQFTHHLADIFVNRWNREQSGELNTPASRRITPELKRRFVLALRDVTFMGLFGKSQKVTGYYYVTLQCLAFLEPSLILPGALQRFYPSLQGLVEVHRTTASLCGLQMIAHILSREKGFRCHVTALLALALPGIDANDLGKTQHTLSFIQSVAHSIPFASLTSDESEVHDTGLAVQWVQGEMERFEREGQDVEIDYSAELSDEVEASILRSSTAGFGEFILALLGKVFTLVENLPDSAHVRSGSPEDNVINSLPAAFTPLFASLSPELFDVALEKLATFVGSHVVNQARDAMAWIINALCKVNPEKSLKVFVPMLIVNIRNEIDYNGAASDRNSGADVLPRDRALVWYVSILSMCVVHVGGEVLKYKNELLSIAKYMQERCRGLPTLHVSNFVHHLLLNLTQTYTIDNAMFEPNVIKDGVRIEHWGHTTAPSELTIKWYRPSQPEIQFATELFESQVSGAKEKMEALMSEEPPVSRKGKNKEWSDELSRALSQIRLVISGVSALFDPARASTTTGSEDRSERNVHGVDDMQIDGDSTTSRIVKGVDDDTAMDEDTDPLAEVADDDELRRQFTYPAGYLLDPKSELFERIHELREDIGRLLSQTHKFLSESQEDDVTCFTALYSTYRTWITDVGFERSAHPLDRLLRLYRSDTASFKINGLRKAYPRALLVKRADAYQLQRVKYNSTYRLKSDLDKRLLLDLAESCTSLYADVRRVAQSSQDSSLKVLIGGRPLVIPVVLDKLRNALDTVDHDRIKGAMYTLLFTSLVKTLLRDWRFAPTLMRLYIETAAVDKASIQHLCASAVYPLLEFGQAFERMVIFDHDMVDAIAPTEKTELVECASKIERRHTFIVGRRAKVEKNKAALGLELAEKAKTTHWKVAVRCAVFANNMCLRFESLAAPAFIDLVASGAIDQHPTLRSSYQSAFSNIFMFIDRRAVYNHDYRLWLLEKEMSKNKLEIPVPSDGGDAEWTRQYLDSFSQQVAEGDEPGDAVPEYFVDSDYPGWLAWGKSFVAYRAKPAVFDGYDEIEKAARSQIGAILTKDWLRQCFDYMKQEPRDTHADRFKVSDVSLLTHIFELVHSGIAAVTFDEVKELTLEVYGDGSDRHQHRATAEILAALLSRGVEEPREYRNRAWAFAAPMLLHVINEKLTPENLQYWMTCVHMITGLRDPRRSRELVLGLESFRLDMTSNAAFKDSSRVSLLEFLISDAGWHFRDEQPILNDILQHLDHPYKAVREAMGRILATIYRTRYYEAFPTVAALLEANKEASSIGIRPYKPSAQFSDTVADVFKRLEAWRLERVPGQQEQSSYTSGSKTVLIWLDWMLSSQECTQLVEFFPEPFIDQLLHMMDVKEDPELMRLAYHVYRHLPNVPLREGEDDAFIRKLIDVGRSASSWHQRLRALINMQRKLLFDSVGDMLADSQLEVRDSAAATLAGMIRCSPGSIRNPIIQSLKLRFQEQLRANPMPKKKRALAADETGRDTPVDMQRQVIRRHAAVLGLGALIEAFPYATPPPAWMPEVLAHLATRTANDPGVVGNATKSILAEFKKTRQDSWTVDQKLEDLEGVHWKSYFA
ncbi:proteasome activator subunit [Grosmannia clavigera kw1407]|uniref:Proteasome activator subunit n=1 Tax=Grosmannia clavigera (strain kw1407 / UAMH 11150) TaxID=655863 RepID=F0X9P7_GROCL|nr:proteasome activator subunit [Grosmannia clavigera kw1407]EFX06177.1 proteasome activator subunit [Grosmannia clavigera kw1407]